MPIFAGLRATNDFTVDGQRPKNWRETILRLYPNGKMPLTALTSLMKSEMVDDPEYNWFVKIFKDQVAPVTGTYTGNTITTALTAAVNAGDLVSVKMAAEHAAMFKTGHTVLFRNASNPDFDTVGRVDAPPTVNGASSFVVVKMLENSRTGFLLTTANISTLYIIGTAYEEGAKIGAAISMDPVKFHNYTQIFRNSLHITRTAKKTKLRTPAAYAEAKRDCLELHGIEMEKAFMFGIPTETIGPEGKPMRTTGGLLWAISKGGGLRSHMPTDMAKGSTWLKDGYNYMMETFEKLFRYGDSEKLCYAGSGAILALNKLAYEKGDWKLTSTDASFGIKVSTLVTPFGEIKLQMHPLFSHEVTNRNSLVIFEPRHIKYRHITDTTFYDDAMKHGHERRDAQMEEYLTEAGLEFGATMGSGYITGVGLDAPAAP